MFRAIKLVFSGIRQLGADVFLNGETLIVLFPVDRQLADINAAGAQIKLVDLLQNREGVHNRELCLLNLLDEAMGLENLNDGAVDE